MSICIIGAGLAGSMLAALLAKLGFSVTLFEKRDDPTTAREILEHSSSFGASTSATKRSINLALSYRGQKAFEELGVLDTVMSQAIPMPCRIIHGLDGSTAKQAYGTSEQAIYSVGRQTLNNLLLEIISNNEKVTVNFGFSLESVDKNGHCVFRSSDGKLLKETYNLVIGADGAYSSTRECILKQGRVNFSRQYIAHGYKELSIPPKKQTTDANFEATEGAHEISYALEDPNGLHIWPRGEFMLIALPNPDHSFTATLFAPYHGIVLFLHARAIFTK